jgi:hypothetical protein
VAQHHFSLVDVQPSTPSNSPSWPPEQAAKPSSQDSRPVSSCLHQRTRLSYSHCHISPSKLGQGAYFRGPRTSFVDVVARGSTSLVWRCVERTGTRLVGTWTCMDGCRLVVETFSWRRRWRRWAWRVLGRPGCWFVCVGHVIRVDPSTSDRRLGLLQIYPCDSEASRGTLLTRVQLFQLLHKIIIIRNTVPFLSPKDLVNVQPEEA